MNKSIDDKIKYESRRSIYKPFDFWNKLNNPNKAITKENKDSIELLRITHINYISKNIKNDKLILDYGCGVGRTIDCYNNNHQIVGVDISLIYKDRIIEKANSLGLHFGWIHVSDNKIPFDDNYFDAAVCTQVLMHTKPDDILVIMNELKRVSKKVIVSSKEIGNKHNSYIGKNRKFKGHRYRYDYEKLCKKYRFNIFNIERYKKNIMFCYN